MIISVCPGMKHPCCELIISSFHIQKDIYKLKVVQMLQPQKYTKK